MLCHWGTPPRQGKAPKPLRAHADYPADDLSVMTAGLAKAQHTVLIGTPCFRHRHTAFLWILRRVVPNRDLIDSGNATGQLRPIRRVRRVTDGVGIGVELQGDRSAAGEQAGSPVLVHGHQRPVDALVKCNVQTVLGNLPFREPYIGIAWFLARNDVFRLGRLHVHPIDWLVGDDVAHMNTRVALAPLIRNRRQLASKILHGTRLETPWPHCNLPTRRLNRVRRCQKQVPATGTSNGTDPGPLHPTADSAGAVSDGTRLR